MSSRGGGAARLATRLREQTASAGAAGAEPTTGTPQRNRPCQCHRPSRGKASILPSKCALFPPGPPLAIVPGRLPVPLVLPDGAAAGIVCPAAPEGFGGSPRRSDRPPPPRTPGCPGPAALAVCGSSGRAPQVVGRSGRQQRSAIPPGRASPTRSSQRGVVGMLGERESIPLPKLPGFPSRGTLSAPSPTCPTRCSPAVKGQGC